MAVRINGHNVFQLLQVHLIDIVNEIIETICSVYEKNKRHLHCLDKVACVL
jgi:predicted metal-dependent HD superfamily phosphohydrolase